MNIVCSTPASQILPSEEERFSTNLIQLSEFVLAIATKSQNKGYNIVDPQVFKIVIAILRQFNKNILIEGFIKRSHKNWQRIKNNDKNFFIENAQDIFKELPSAEVNTFKELFTIKDVKGNSIVEKDDEASLWRFFESLVKISIKYVHKKRIPRSRKQGTTTISEYTGNFLPDLDLEVLSKTWNIRLDFPS